MMHDRLADSTRADTDGDEALAQRDSQHAERLALPSAAAYDEFERPRSRRRFQRSRRSTTDEPDAGESLAALHAEVLLLREENARLKVARHQPSDISRLLDRARSLSSREVDRDGLGDQTAQMLIDGLVIRESLLAICQEIERSMVAFEAKLDALVVAAADHALTSSDDDDNDNGSSVD